jgi:hypothetical protein
MYQVIPGKIPSFAHALAVGSVLRDSQGLGEEQSRLLRQPKMIRQRPFLTRRYSLTL